eukprot:GHVT01006921.1.p1 GENE.GHVT01006921.1~~GHVT01006921.1.p1  ORF type:complete len:205 (-),score=29.93 GHVT01006921.1:127-741(-)
MKANATTAAARKASWKPPSSWRCSTHRWAKRSALTSKVSASEHFSEMAVASHTTACAGDANAPTAITCPRPESLGNPIPRWASQDVRKRAGLSAAQNVDELLTHRLLLYQFVACLLGKSLKVTHRPHIGGQYLQELAAGHFCQGLFGFENGQRAVQAPGVDFFVCFHGHQSLLGRPSPRRRSAFSSSVKNTGSCPLVRSQSANA